MLTLLIVADKGAKTYSAGQFLGNFPHRFSAAGLVNMFDMLGMLP